MYLEILQELGLSQTEAKIYECLVASGEASVPEISLRISVHRRNVYDVLPKLLKKGLVFQVVEAKEKRYRAVAPSKLRDLIREKEDKLETFLPGLLLSYQKNTSHEEVYVYKGKEGFKNYLRDILRVGEDVAFIGAKGGWFDPDLKTFIQHFFSEAKARGIRYRHIFDAEVADFAPDLLQHLGKPYRFLPPAYSTTGAIDVFGDHIVTFNGLTLKGITEDVTLVVIVNAELAGCYRTWFQFMWDSLDPSSKLSPSSA